MSQNTEVQNKLVEEAHLKILVNALDSTHDPQLLCLVLQIVATLALVPDHHTALTDAELPDSLTQLVLPSDEWYYTNHSTKYARYVKHHAARVLVYLGMEQRLRNKVYLFDLIGEPLLNTPSQHSHGTLLGACEVLVSGTWCKFSQFKISWGEQGRAGIYSRKHIVKKSKSQRVRKRE
ncbi:hypothetical protein HPB48_014127 [Haemaphysalis longicornis]|uniref:Uncharacterized protein n=1 Tax=Haemaphysalis longicornis TaxID=44386 RepID=A0A9J6FJF2_HAELO|nr:hypothetical protein HPB48_014127 [Haemaphysalis longicornis]